MTNDERNENVATIIEFAEVRAQFREEAAKQYPHSGQPEMVWLFDMVLGIDPRNVAADPITRKSYKVFVTDEHGKHMIDPKTNMRFRVTRYFTPEQRTELKNWWAFLPDNMRVSN